MTFSSIQRGKRLHILCASTAAASDDITAGKKTNKQVKNKPPTKGEMCASSTVEGDKTEGFHWDKMAQKIAD